MGGCVDEAIRLFCTSNNDTRQGNWHDGGDGKIKLNYIGKSLTS